MAEKVNAWKEAVLDECMISWSAWYDDNPKKTVGEMIDWHVKIALDPKVSSSAQALVEQGAREEKERNVAVYYEEKEIDGIWYFKSSPEGAWSAKAINAPNPHFQPIEVISWPEEFSPTSVPPPTAKWPFPPMNPNPTGSNTKTEQETPANIHVIDPPEKSRTYFYKDKGRNVKLKGVTSVAISPSGNHRITAKDGLHVVVPGWHHIKIKATNWSF